jgi:hypothetical protein
MSHQPYIGAYDPAGVERCASDLIELQRVTILHLGWPEERFFTGGCEVFPVMRPPVSRGSKRRLHRFEGNSALPARQYDGYEVRSVFYTQVHRGRLLWSLKCDETDKTRSVRSWPCHCALGHSVLYGPNNARSQHSHRCYEHSKCTNVCCSTCNI